MNPLMTAGWRLNPGRRVNHAEHPVPAGDALEVPEFALETTRMARPVSLAAAYACSAETSAPTFQAAEQREPSTFVGPCPEMRAREPTT